MTSSFSTIIMQAEIVLPVFLIIGLGYFSAWQGKFNEAWINGLVKFAQNFAIPALLFRAAATLDIEQAFSPTLLISFYASAALCFFLGFLGARFIFKRAWDDSVCIGFCCLFSNTLLLGLPITERAYGEAALAGNYAIISIHSLFCYCIGIVAMEVAKTYQNKQALAPKASTRAPKWHRFFSSLTELVTHIATALSKNMLILALGAGYCLNILELSIPLIIDSALLILISAALPSALFALGGVLTRYRLAGDMRVALYICFISLFLHPLFTYLMGTGMLLPEAGMRSSVITAAMPPGINAYIFASMYGKALRVSASSVLFATAFSIVSASLWIAILP